MPARGAAEIRERCPWTAVGGGGIDDRRETFHALGDVISPVIIGLLADWLHDMSKAFVIVAVMFPVAGALWLFGARFLERDTKPD